MLLVHFIVIEDSSFATDSEPKPVLQDFLTVIVRAGAAVFSSFNCRIFGPEFQLETQVALGMIYIIVVTEELVSLCHQ